MKESSGSKSVDNSLKAEEAWNEVQDSPTFDLKYLIKEVSVVVARRKEAEKAGKAEKNRKAGKVKRSPNTTSADRLPRPKVSLVTRAKMAEAKVELKKAEVRETVLVESNTKDTGPVDDMMKRLEAEAALGKLVSDLDKALAAPSNLSEILLRQLEEQYAEVVRLIRDAGFNPVDAIHDRTSEAFATLLQLKNLARLHEEENRKRRLERLKMLKIDFFARNDEAENRPTDEVGTALAIVQPTKVNTSSTEVVVAKTPDVAAPTPVVIRQEVIKEAAPKLQYVERVEPLQIEGRKQPKNRLLEAKNLVQDVKPKEQPKALEWSKKTVAPSAPTEATPKPVKNETSNAPTLTQEPTRKNPELIESRKEYSMVGSTMKWVQNRLKHLSTSLWGILRHPVRSAGSAKEGLLNGVMAATAVSALIVPLLKGVNEELERRFGEKYISKFISGLWENTWSWLVQQVRDLFGLKDQSKVEKERDQARGQVEATVANKDSTPSQVMSSKLDFLVKQQGVADQPTGALTASKATATAVKARTNLQNDVMDAPNGSITPELAARLTAQKIKVPPEKVGRAQPMAQAQSTPTTTTSTTTESVAEPTPASQTTNTPVMQVTPTVSTANGAPQVSVTPQPMEATTPQPTPSVKPKAPEKSNVSQQGVSTEGTQYRQTALGATQIPTFASNESLTVFNMSVLT